MISYISILRYSYNTIKKLPPYNAIWENNVLLKTIIFKEIF